MIGETLGQYKIEALLGAGGMGTVYRARDAKLRRDVAIKVLSPEFAGDAERLARFEREARLLASLNHPNVATIHGLESTGELSFLVMELVEGETLAEALERGPLPIEEALSLFRQIAAGLEAAHGKGVVHRDLKPANIMITPDGDVKILDFGLAKALAVEDDARDDISRSPTLTIGTALGVILGTAPYMSPEQARGRVVDRRTDIWAFGCCLYESLTGRRPFDGDTVTDILAAVVNNEPEWNRLPADTPSSVTRVLRRCLEKDRRRRLRDIGDAAMDLQASGESDAPSSVGRSMMITIAVGVVSALVSGVVVWSLSSSSEAPTSGNGALVKRATVELAAPLALSETAPLGIARSVIALSRDGNHLVYVALQNGATQLYHRSLSELGARPISGTEGGFAPFFSPDGRSVGFFTADRLKKVSLLGGEPSTLCEARNPFSGSWGDDGFIVFTSREGSNVSRVPASGGQPEVLLRSDLSSGETVFAQLQLLPGGTHALVSMDLGRVNPDYFSIFTVSLESGERSFVVEGASPTLAASGHLIFSRSGALFAAPWDSESRTLVGDAAPILEGVRMEDTGQAQFAFSDDGTMVYVEGPTMSAAQPVWRDRNGAVTPLALRRQVYGTFELSPDGNSLAIVIADAQQDIWIHDLARESLSRLTLAGLNNWPVWIPDAQRVTFLKVPESGGYGHVYWKAADGSGEAERLLGGDFTAVATSWLPDGSALAMTNFQLGDVLRLSMEGREVEPLLQSPAIEWGLTFSPDGRLMAYTSDESGRYEVYVQPYPPTGPKFQISTGGGEEPQWSPRGDELFYRNGNEWMRAAITNDPELEISRPQMLFRGNYVNVLGPSYDVSPDGERFLLLQPPHQDPPTELHLIVNWFEELERLAPTQ